MGMMDRFLNTLRLNSDEDDYYDDEDYYDDDEEDIYEPPRRMTFRRDHQKKEARGDDEPASSPAKEKERESRQSSHSAQTGKVTPMRTPRKAPGGGQGAMEVCVVKPESVEDAKEITMTLLAGRTVVLNLEGLDLDIAQRIIDFTSGSCFSVNGNLQKVSHYIFIVTPQSVDLSGDFQDIVNSFDVSSLQMDI